MTSVWMATDAGPPTYPPIDETLTVDVAVLGAGIAGLTTALLCQREGLRVAVVEAARVASGVTGHTTAKITALQEPVYATFASDFGEDVARAYARANIDGLETIARLVDELHIECGFERRSAYTYALSEETTETLRRELDAARAAGLAVEETNDTGLPFEVETALRLDGQAQFHARRYCRALAAEVAGKGGVIAETVRATKVRGGTSCVVETDHAEVRAADVVVATHIPFMFRGLFFAKTRPSRSYAVAARYDREPPGGMYLSADKPVRSVRDYDKWLIVGGESHKTGQGKPEDLHFQALREWGAEHFGLGSYEFEWSAQDPVSGDGLPMVGTLTPTTRHVWVATAFRKWGMANATAAAEILTAGITGREHPLAKVFDPRGHPVATLRRMLGEGADTAKHFVGDRVAARLRAQPGPGEGAVVREHGNPVAVYVDADGSRHAVSAVCTHLGCLVGWNEAERTWDCPCHGSRFAVDGTVIEGPAVSPLEAVEG